MIPLGTESAFSSIDAAFFDEYEPRHAIHTAIEVAVRAQIEGLQVLHKQASCLVEKRTTPGFLVVLPNANKTEVE